MRFRRATAIFAILALAAAFSATPNHSAQAKNDKAAGASGQAQGKGKGKPPKAGKHQKGGKPDHAGKGKKGDADYSEWRRDYRDEDVVEELRRYRREYGDRTPDYLRNPTALPPGIAKNLQRGKPLPPGIAKKVDNDDLLRRLPQTYPGSEWYTAGDQMVEYDPVNEAIIHVINSAIYGGF